MNAAISLSVNFQYDYLKPYLKSFNDCVNADLFMITDHNTTTVPLKTNKIHFINVFELIKKYNVANLTPYNLKPVLFYLFLKELKATNKYKNILLTDVDVIFQDDPFIIYNNSFTNADLVLCEERHFYKDCQTNSIWFKQGYNDSYNQVKDKKY